MQSRKVLKLNKDNKKNLYKALHSNKLNEMDTLDNSM